MENWLGSRIKRLRSIRGITQEKLAELCNVSPSCVSRWERGSLYPRRDSLEALAKALDAEPGELFCISENPLSHNQLINETVILMEKLDQDEQEFLLSGLQSYLEMKHRKFENN